MLDRGAAKPERPRGRLGPARLLAAGLAALAVCALLGALCYAPSLLRAAVVLGTSMDLYDASGLPRWLSHPVRVTPETIPIPQRSLRSQRYAPEGLASAPVALLLHGVHPRGIDEPRLIRFAYSLAGSGLEVHTPELPDLPAFRLTPQLVQDITACAASLQAQRGRKVGAFGISFAGGLLLLAAASPQGAAVFDYAVALGAHADLRRLARHYAGEAIAGPGAQGRAFHPDPYGSRILATAFVQDLFAPEEAAAARQALALHLAERYRDAARVRAGLSPAAQQRLSEVLGKPTPALRAELLHIAERHAAELAAASPAGKLSGLRVPVFLLHGRDDPIIPSVESEWLAREVPARALKRVLITKALRHAESGGPAQPLETARLIAFLAAVLREADP